MIARTTKTHETYRGRVQNNLIKEFSQADLLSTLNYLSYFVIVIL